MSGKAYSSGKGMGGMTAPIPLSDSDRVAGPHRMDVSDSFALCKRTLLLRIKNELMVLILDNRFDSMRKNRLAVLRFQGCIISTILRDHPAFLKSCAAVCSQD
jgi:hypothetical protein